MDISLSSNKRDWQSLERKLSRGVPFEDAVVSVGIPIEEAKEWAKEKSKEEHHEDLVFMRTAHSALEDGLDVLKQLAFDALPTDGPRVSAASKMVDTAVKLFTLSRGKKLKVESTGQLDLFDKSPFTFKNDPPKG